MAAPILVDPCINRCSSGASLIERGAETRATFAVDGPAPKGMMLLGTTQSIAEKLGKVQHF